MPDIPTKPPSPPILSSRIKLHPFNSRDHKMRQIVIPNPILQIRRQKKPLVSIEVFEFEHEFRL
jgi:hypothetical protein